MTHIKIIHEPNALEPFLVLEKPAGIPSAPLFACHEVKFALRAFILFYTKIVFSKFNNITAVQECRAR